ncbi:MAG: peptidoglycan-binding domain-containing protein, partial [Burkholderiaceae bacterium]
MAASGETEDHKAKARGFAGLSLLVSDVDTILRSVGRPEAPARLEEPARPVAGAGDPHIAPIAAGYPAAEADEFAVARQAGAAPIAAPLFAPVDDLPPSRPPRSSWRMPILAAGIAGIIAAIWLFSPIGEQGEPPDLTPGDQIATTTPSPAPSSPAPVAAGTAEPTETPPPADAAAASARPEAQGQEGGSETTRVEQAAPGEASAESSARSPTESPTQSPAVEPQAAEQQPEPDTTTLAAQRRLRELGYSTGNVDGVPDSRTREAIVAFQVDHGHNASGVADAALLRQLDAALVRVHIDGDTDSGAAQTTATSSPPGAAEATAAITAAATASTAPPSTAAAPAPAPTAMAPTPTAPASEAPAAPSPSPAPAPA